MKQLVGPIGTVVETTQIKLINNTILHVLLPEGDWLERAPNTFRTCEKVYVDRRGDVKTWGVYKVKISLNTAHIVTIQQQQKTTFE